MNVDQEGSDLAVSDVHPIEVQQYEVQQPHGERIQHDTYASYPQAQSEGNPDPPLTRRCKEPGCRKMYVKKGYCTIHARMHGIETAKNLKKCDEEGCEKLSYTKGWCRVHARAHGIDVDTSRKRCDVEGCGKHVAKKNYCMVHARAAGLYVNESRSIRAVATAIVHANDVEGGYVETGGVEVEVKGFAPKSSSIVQTNEGVLFEQRIRCRQEGCDRALFAKGLCRAHAREVGVLVPYKRCSEPECGKHVAKRGYCVTHARARGIPMNRNSRKCEEEGCDKPTHKRGYCRVHARRRGYYNPAPTPPLPYSPAEGGVSGSPTSSSPFSVKERGEVMSGVMHPDVEHALHQQQSEAPHEDRIEETEKDGGHIEPNDNHNSVILPPESHPAGSLVQLEF